MGTPTELSVVALCFRAEEHLAAFAEPLSSALEAAGVQYELVLVANYWPESGDTTPEQAKTFAERHPNVVVVADPKQGAMGWDLRSGLEATRGRYLVYLDGDGQVPGPAVLDVFRRLRSTGAHVVKGRRHMREDGSIRTITSLGFNLLFRLLFRSGPLWDVNGQPKGMTRAAYERLDLRTDDWFTDAEILLKAKAAGMTVEEVTVQFLPKGEGASHVGLNTVWEFLANMARWRLGRHPAQGARGQVSAGEVARARH
ncbi:MAG: glycosyltransferase family 2 protein [Gaiellaceae bacterium]